jgi:hypothetical protein
VFSERIWSLSRQAGMSRKLARGAEGSNRSNRLQAPSVFDALFPVKHCPKIVAESQ